MTFRLEKHAVLPHGYELLESLGQSGCGSGYCVSSWLARDACGEKVVIRHHITRPSDEYGGEDDLRDRVTARLPYLKRVLALPPAPGIARWHTFQFDPEEGYVFFVRDYFDAKWSQCFPAAITADRHGRPNADFLAAFRQVAAAVDFLLNQLGLDFDHSLHLGNLFLDGSQVWLTEMGMKSLGDSIEFGYSGPRSVSLQAMEVPANWTRWLFGPDHPSPGAQFELAAVYFHARTGFPLFPAKPLARSASWPDRMRQLHSEMAAYQQGQPADLSRLPNRQEREVVARALAVDPARRFATCTEFIDTLL